MLQAGDAVLAAGAADDIDRSIVRSVAVPADRQPHADIRHEVRDGVRLGLRLRAGLDGRRPHLAEPRHPGSTTSEHDPAARSSIIAQLPGLNGTAAWHAESFDLSAFAGKTVLLRFRMTTDGATLGNGGEAGWWVDDVRVGRRARLRRHADRLGHRGPADRRLHGAAGRTRLEEQQAEHSRAACRSQTAGRPRSAGARSAALSGNQAATVGAIVMYDEPTRVDLQVRRLTR